MHVNCFWHFQIWLKNNKIWAIEIKIGVHCLYHRWIALFLANRWRLDALTPHERLCLIPRRIPFINSIQDLREMIMYMKSCIGMVRFFYCLSNNYVKDVNNNYDVQGEPLPCEKKIFQGSSLQKLKKNLTCCNFSQSSWMSKCILSTFLYR